MFLFLLIMKILFLILTLFQVIYSLSVTGCADKDYEAYLADYSSKNGANNPTYIS